MKRFWKIFFSTLDSDSCPGFCRCHQHRCQSPIFSVTNLFLTRATFETYRPVLRYKNLKNETINILSAVCIGVNITIAVGFVVTFAEIRAFKLHLWRLYHHTNPALVTLLKSFWSPTSQFSHQSQQIVTDFTHQYHKYILNLTSRKYDKDNQSYYRSYSNLRDAIPFQGCHPNSAGI